MFPSRIGLTSGLLLALLSNTVDAEATTGNTTCADNTFDLYTQEAGETPCKTYERLRQICNPDYIVPTFPITVPPDLCDDQNSSCCCNSVAWYLAMLCMNCQLGTHELQGFDAVGNGYYQKYLQGRRQSESCSPQLNGSLPIDTQLEVCNRKIKIPNLTYRYQWADTASWYWYYYWQQLTLTLNTGPAAFTTCDYESITSSESSISSVTTLPAVQPSEYNPTSLSSGATAGIAFGAAAVGVAVTLGLVFALLRLLRKRQGSKDGDRERPLTSEERVDPYMIKFDPSVSMSSRTPLRPRGVGKFRGEGEMSMAQAQAQASGSNRANQNQKLT